MFKKDLLLSSSHDLEIIDFDLQLTSDQQAVAQRVKQALLLFKGEWFLDRDLGVPYYEDILGTKNSIDTVRGVFVNAIRAVDGVKDLIEFNIEFDDATRTLGIKLTIIDDLSNEINIEL
jgi:hypothetical protein